MRILLLCESYPTPDRLYAMGFVHSRAIEYAKAGHRVSVLSFSASGPYEFEGIEVLSREDTALRRDFDIVLSHAPNVRHHLAFLAGFPPLPLVMFIHGHEMLLMNRYYPRPYDFDRGWKETARQWGRTVYDPLKLALMQRFCKRQTASARPLGFVFVSDWMHREAMACNSWLRDADWPVATIPNAVNAAFAEREYHLAQELLADFVCIRPFDNPKYAVDEVLAWAKLCPHKTFHLYGRGRYFEFHAPPPNVTVFQRFIAQKEIPALLDRYRACVMPTRLDSQGVMMCEMATYGIPLFTSDTEVTRQMLEGFRNVALVPQGAAVPSMFDELPLPLKGDEAVRRRFDASALAAQELAFATRLLGRV